MLGTTPASMDARRNKLFWGMGQSSSAPYGNGNDTLIRNLTDYTTL